MATQAPALAFATFAADGTYYSPISITGSAARLGRDVTVNGEFFPIVDGAYIAGPQWAQYMQQALGFYDHGEFTPPPQNLIAGSAPQSRGGQPALPQNGRGRVSR